jgi:hypothetical protein
MSISFCVYSMVMPEECKWVGWQQNLSASKHSLNCVFLPQHEIAHFRLSPLFLLALDTSLRRESNGIRAFQGVIHENEANRACSSSVGRKRMGPAGGVAGASWEQAVEWKSMGANKYGE